MTGDPTRGLAAAVHCRCGGDGEAEASARDPAMSMRTPALLTGTIMEDVGLPHGSATHYYKPPRK